MNFLIKLLTVALSVFLAAEILPGVNVLDFKWALAVALVLSLLNTFVKPVLIFLTIPATIISLGLFLFVINACVILLADYLIVSAFEVNGFWWALVFSIVVSVLSSIIQKVTGQKKKNPKVRN